MEPEAQMELPFNFNFAVAPEDTDSNGELTEEGKIKLDKILRLIEKMKEQEIIEKNKLALCKTRLEQHYDYTEGEWQQRLKELITKFGRREDFKHEDQFDKFTLSINFSKEVDWKLFKVLLLTRVPKIHSLFLSFINKDSIEDIRKFMDCSFPHRINWLALNFSGRPKGKDDLLDLGELIKSLVDISDLVIEEIQIWNCLITADALNTLVVNFCHVKKLWICWSLFNFNKKDTLDFSLSDKPNIEEISFEGWGDSILNDWEENLDQLDQIMKAFKLSEIKNTIKQVLLDDCNIEESTISEIMNKNEITYNK